MSAFFVFLAATTSIPTKPPHMVPPEQFVVSYWWGLPPSETTQARYAEIAKAGFNLVTPYLVKLPLDEARAHNQKVLDLCKANGLKAIVLDPRVWGADPQKPGFEKDMDDVVHDYGKHPALLGYFVEDEPVDADFPRLAAIHNALLKRDPHHLPFINLLPVVASELFGGPRFVNDPKDYPAERDVYSKHVNAFIQTIKPKLLSYDEYDLFEGGGIRGMFFANLELIRRAALDHRLPFWNIVLVTPHAHVHGTYRDPSFADLRFLVYSTLAYGARGMTYFTYYPPPGRFGEAVIGHDGKRTRHYDELRRLNFQIHRLAPTLSKLRSDGVYHAGRLPLECAPLPPGGILANIHGGDALVGFFSCAKGKRYLMVVNTDLTQTRVLTLEFSRKVRVRELSVEDGEFRRIPGSTSFAADFLAGQGRFYEFAEINPSLE